MQIDGESFEALAKAVFRGDLAAAEAAIEEMKFTHGSRGGVAEAILRAKREARPEQYRTGAANPNPLADDLLLDRTAAAQAAAGGSAEKIMA